MPLPAYRSHDDSRDRSRSRISLLLSRQQRKQLFLLIGFCLIYSYSFFNLQPDRSFDRVQKWNNDLKLKEKNRLEKRKMRNKKRQHVNNNNIPEFDNKSNNKEEEEVIDVEEWERKMREGGEGGLLTWKREQERLAGIGTSDQKYLRGVGEDEEEEGTKRKRQHRKRNSAEAMVDFIVMMSVFVITRTVVRMCLYYRYFQQAMRDQGGILPPPGSTINRSNSRSASLARMVVPQSVHAHAMLLRNARFRAWVSQLNRERQQQGQPPLSLESLRLVLRERDFSGNDYEALMRFHEEATLAQSMGATQAEIDRCPQRRISDPNDELLTSPDYYHPREEGRAQHCAICLEMYQMGDHVRTLPCHHVMHVGCIDPWLLHRAVCPVCKHPANGS